jgi:hypothetical protein
LFSTLPIRDSISIKSQGQDNIIDGVVSAEEYDHNATFSDGDYKLYWSVNNSEIYIAMVGKTTGWVSLGIDPVTMMEGADMIFGWVNNTGHVEVIDAYATGPTGPHPPDTDPILGGTADITVFNGTEINGETTIEFKRSLETGDSYDKSLPLSEEVTIIWAIGASDTFGEQHTKRGYGSFSLEGAVGRGNDFAAPLVLSTSLLIGLVGLFIFVDSTSRQDQKSEKKDQDNGGSN